MAACKKITTEATNQLGQRNRRGLTKDCFLLNSWFESKSYAEALMDVGYEIIGMVKTNTNYFCKGSIKNMKKDLLGDS